MLLRRRLSTQTPPLHLLLTPWPPSLCPSSLKIQKRGQKNPEPPPFRVHKDPFNVLLLRNSSSMEGDGKERKNAGSWMQENVLG